MTREEAIALVREVSNYMATRPEIDEAIDMAIKALEKEQERGKWILESREIYGNYRYRCSECGHTDIQAKTQEVPYCWYCGASMESDNE